jgi:cyclase
MAKKRVIFTLLYSEGSFFLSRNFRLQKGGNVSWLLKNFKFSELSRSIDELIIVDVSRGAKDRGRFIADVREVIKACFIPVALGGGIDKFEDASLLIQGGADKLVFTSSYATAPEVIREVIHTYGQQCVVGCIDVKASGTGYDAYVLNGREKVGSAFPEWVRTMQDVGFGELMIQSIDLDGTGFGLDLEVVDQLPAGFDKPLILCGGSGKSDHILGGLADPRVDAVATANLFNFIGDGLANARTALFNGGLDLARWEAKDAKRLHAHFQAGGQA